MKLGWSLITAVNDEAVLNGTLLKSPAIDGSCQVITKHGFSSAGRAYNAGIAEAKSEILVFTHQDVYLPKNWSDRLTDALNELEAVDPRWGVLGVYGISRSEKGEGHVYSTGLARTLGQPFKGPVEAVSLDELVLIMRRSANLSFDKEFPGFHLYGTDICMEAEKRGLKNYIVPAFCIHNSNGIQYLPIPFWRSYLYLRKKWWNQLPLRSPCMTITRGCLPVLASLLRDFSYLLLRSSNVGKRCLDPRLLPTGPLQKSTGARQ